MLEHIMNLLLETILSRRKVRALRALRALQTLVAGVTATVMILVPGAAAAIFRTAIREEQARITPLVEQIVRRLSQHLDHGRPLRLSHAVQQHPHR
jgi:hypothetical protein